MDWPHNRKYCDVAAIWLLPMKLIIIHLNDKHKVVCKLPSLNLISRWFVMSCKSEVYHEEHHGLGVYWMSFICVVNIRVNDRKCDTHREKEGLGISKIIWQKKLYCKPYINHIDIMVKVSFNGMNKNQNLCQFSWDRYRYGLGLLNLWQYYTLIYYGYTNQRVHHKHALEEFQCILAPNLWQKHGQNVNWLFGLRSCYDMVKTTDVIFSRKIVICS
jgi:hypothetical protein